jgi:DNA-binding NtrC family response regulator
VLFDLRASDGDAVDVLRDMRRGYPDCRFVIMTTAHDCSLRYAFADAVEVMHKPFDLAKVVQVVKELAGRHRTAGGLAPPRDRAGDAA